MPLHGFPSDSSHKVAGRKDLHLCKCMCQNRLWSIPEDNSTRAKHQGVPISPNRVTSRRTAVFCFSHSRSTCEGSQLILH